MLKIRQVSRRWNVLLNIRETLERNTLEVGAADEGRGHAIEEGRERLLQDLVGLFLFGFTRRVGLELAVALLD